MTWTYLLTDRDSDTELADLSEWALTKKISPRLNRPLSTVLTLPGDTAVLRSTSFDGRPNLEVGTRAIKAYQDGVLRGHTIVWNIAPAGDANQTQIMVTGHDPLIILRRRPVRDSDGSLVEPTFATPITGAEILKQAIENSVSNTGPAGDMEGFLPIDAETGIFATTVDLAAALTNWPIMIADLWKLITDTGVVDAVLDPVDTGDGFAAGIMARLNVVDQAGSDVSGSVHFDYSTGIYNVSNIRRSLDMDEVCNKLQYYLGPRIDEQHWRGNITATEAGLEAYAALQLASRDRYGTLMDIRFYDDADDENDFRRLFHELWKTEVTLRVAPRELLSLQPAADGSFRPFIDYVPGDIVSGNAADIVGPAVAGAQQRLYGFDVEEDKDGVERVGELLVSADGL